MQKPCFGRKYEPADDCSNRLLLYTWAPGFLSGGHHALLIPELACVVQIQNEKLTGVVNKMAGERELVLRQVQGFLEKQEKVATQLDQLNTILEQTEEKIKRADAEAKVITCMTVMPYYST